MTTPRFTKGDMVRRNGSKLASVNTFRITQVHVSESGKLIRYVAWNESAESTIAIYPHTEAHWSKVVDNG